MAAPGLTRSSPVRGAGRGRRPSLNTIVEENTREPGSRDDPFATSAGRINRNNLNSPKGSGVVGRFDAVDKKMNWQLGREHHHSPASSASHRRRNSTTHRTLTSNFDDLYDASEESDTDSHKESAPSAEGSEDERDETHHQNTKRGQNRYPVLFIPSSSASEGDGILKTKNSPVTPTPAAKIPLSPSALSRLPGIVPHVNDAPSLAGSHSAPSSAHPSSASAPSTPDLAPVQDPEWGEQQLQVYSGDEAAKDSTPSSTSISPQPDIQLETPEDWSLVLNGFPRQSHDEHDPGQVSDSAPGSDAESQGSVSVSSSVRGVRLPRAALATLRGFDVDDQSSRNSTPDIAELGQMRESSTTRPHLRRRSTGGGFSSTEDATASPSYTPLSVPSPGGFFASLKGETRRTWCINSLDTPSSATSAAAERFYRLPWDAPSDTVVEHVIPANQGNPDDDDDDGTEGPPTAKAITSSGPPTARRVTEETATTVATSNRRQSTDNQSQDINELVEYDELYEDELKVQASANLDRTSHWLAAQSTYLSALGETNPLNEVDSTRPAFGRHGEETSTAVVAAKNGEPTLGTVFETPEAASSSPSAAKNPLFYKGFQYVRKRSGERETFHRSYFRFEAIQAARSSLIRTHVDHLTGKYEPSEHVRPPYKGPFSMAPRNSKQPQILMEQAMFSKVEKEQNVLSQLRQSMWAIDALKFLNRGRLIPSPAADRLAKAESPLGTPENSGKFRRRVLDLGGHPSCGWGWYVAQEYPNVKVYTVVPKQQATNPDIKGPSNHRCVSVPELWNLPFADNQFDLVSARHLHMLLKFHRSVDGVPEPDLCLQECLRCLKPGGYLEFFTMDAELARAGSYGSATSVEFGFNLKTRGYDPCPTRMILPRLKKVGFTKLKRAWTFLPMAMAPPEGAEAPTYAPDTALGCGGESKRKTTGSTSVISSTTGLFGGWMWEQWMLKLQMEMDRDKDSFLEEMATIFEEGKKTGAGWRCLSGWAVKPRNSRNSAKSLPPPVPSSHPPLGSVSFVQHG